MCHISGGNCNCWRFGIRLYFLYSKILWVMVSVVAVRLNIIFVINVIKFNSYCVDINLLRIFRKHVFYI